MKRLAPILGIAFVVVVIVLPRLGGARQPHPAYDAALAKTQAEGKCVFIAFTGSDWCDWCVKFEHEILERPDFRHYADSNLVLMVVDFPRSNGVKPEEQRKQDAQLARRFRVESFPTVFVVCPQGRAIAKTGYRAGGSKEYVDHIKKLITDAR